jgi:ubiquinone/menaquinone biosynthesis C-methylase UbiE
LPTTRDHPIAHTVYSHLVNPESALTEAGRVLKPGGQLVIFGYLAAGPL